MKVLFQSEAWESHYTPMRIVARMSEPIAHYEDGLYIDGIIAAAAFRDLDERTRRRIPPLSSEWAVDVKLPLGRWVVDVGSDWDGGDKRLLRRLPGRRGRKGITTELWGWRASAVQTDWSLRGTAEVRKRPELDLMRRMTKDASVDIRAGALKAHDLKFPTVFAHELTWYAYGDVDEVQRLLRKHIFHIGKKRHHGWGHVMSWEVEQISDDLSVLDGDRLMRRLPIESGFEGAPGHASIRPPYHHPSRVVEVVEPTA